MSPIIEPPERDYRVVPAPEKMRWFTNWPILSVLTVVDGRAIRLLP